MAELKVITPYILLNYAEMLEAQGFFEEGFKIYEQGVSLFVWPGVYDIWVTYLSKLVQRYEEKKLERARDLFEKVLQVVPQNVTHQANTHIYNDCQPTRRLGSGFENRPNLVRLYLLQHSISPPALLTNYSYYFYRARTSSKASCST